MLAAGAGLFAVLAGAGFGLSLLSGSSATSGPTSGVAAGSAAGPNAHAAAPRAAGASSSGAKRYENGFSNSTANGSGMVVNVVSSGVDYRTATLEQQVADQLAIRSALHAAPAPTGLAACVRNVSGDNPVLLAESAHYNGKPATIVVLTRGAQTEAVVAGPTCTATVSDILASVVLPPGISTP